MRAMLQAWLRFWRPRLRRELALALAFKIAFLWLLGHYFFSHEELEIQTFRHVRTYYDVSSQDIGVQSDSISKQMELNDATDR